MTKNLKVVHDFTVEDYDYVAELLEDCIEKNDLAGIQLYSTILHELDHEIYVEQCREEWECVMTYGGGY